MDEGMNGGAPIRRPLSARQRETTTRRFRLIFEVGGGRPFLEIEGKKGGSFDTHSASSCAWLDAVVVITMAAKDLLWRRSANNAIEAWSAPLTFLQQLSPGSRLWLTPEATG
jgi:hypothetical protein